MRAKPAAILRIFSILLALAAVAGLDGLLIRPGSAEAQVDCSQTHIMRVLIGYEDTGTGLPYAGSRVEITPDPRDGSGSRTYVDNGDFDDEPLSGFVIEDSACRIEASGREPGEYRVRLLSVPSECEVVGDSTQSTVLERHLTLQFDVTRCRLPEVAVRAADRSPGCGESTAVITRVTLDGRPVPDGALVRFSASSGSVEPAQILTSNGEAFATYRAPSQEDGEFRIIADVGEARAIATVVSGCVKRPASSLRVNTADAACNSTAAVTFMWSALSSRGAVSKQWLDLSLFDNGFAPGSFIAAGPLSPDVRDFRWQDLLPGLPHFWRVNTLTAEGWLTSETKAFVPCGGPQLRYVTHDCTPNGLASVTFRWAPPAPGGAGFGNWLDLSLFDNGFAPGTFLSRGPQHIAIWAVEQELTWHGIEPNRLHYWRFNTLFETGWDPSETGSFVAEC